MYLFFKGAAESIRIKGVEDWAEGGGCFSLSGF
jgi:hypothetical protein